MTSMVRAPGAMITDGDVRRDREVHPHGQGRKGAADGRELEIKGDTLCVRRDRKAPIRQENTQTFGARG